MHVEVRSTAASTAATHGRRALAVLSALVCHGTFLVAIGFMVLALWDGMSVGRGTLEGPAAWWANGALLLQFPLLHSFLLGTRGRAVLARLVPGAHGRTLATTTFATLASLQLLATFTLWSPTGVMLWEPTGAQRLAFLVPFAAAWVFLVLALRDGGLPLQTGSLGWRALWSGQRPAYGGLPTGGTFALCRQPIYFGFALTLWTGPTWSLDHLFVALVWTTYCLFGPLLKERRFQRCYGASFDDYRSRTPYFFPRLLP